MRILIATKKKKRDRKMCGNHLACRNCVPAIIFLWRLWREVEGAVEVWYNLTAFMLRISLLLSTLLILWPCCCNFYLFIHLDFATIIFFSLHICIFYAYITVDTVSVEYLSTPEKNAIVKNSIRMGLTALMVEINNENW